MHWDVGFLVQGARTMIYMLRCEICMKSNKRIETTTGYIWMMEHKMQTTTDGLGLRERLLDITLSLGFRVIS